MFLGIAGGGTFFRRSSRIVLTRPENPVEESLGVIMRKLALLLAASLLVTAPLLAVSTNDTYAAAKAKKAAKGGAEKGAKGSPGDSNTAFMRAVGDLGASLGQPYDQRYEGGKGGKAKAAKSGGRKAAKRSRGKKSKRA